MPIERVKKFPVVTIDEELDDPQHTDLKVKLRIATIDYPQSEALYGSIQEFEEASGQLFEDYL